MAAGLLRAASDRLLERNLADAVSGRYANRSRAIAEVNHWPGRLEQRVLDFVHRHPEAVAKVAGIEVPEHIRIVGGGSNNTVVQYKGDPMVVKVHRASTWMSREQQDNLANQLSLQHRAMRRYLGGAVLPQTTHVAPHPLRPGRTAVISIQQAVEYVDLGLFPSQGSGFNRDQAMIAEDLMPGFAGELHEFGANASELLDITGYVTNTSGPGNMVIANQGGVARLTCLDAVPLENPKPHDIERMQGQYDLMRAHYYSV